MHQKNNIIINIVAITMLFVFINSCNKESEAPLPAEPQVIKKLVTVLIDNGTFGVLNLEYNGNNLSKGTYVGTNNYSVTFTYDSNDKVVSRTLTIPPTYEEILLYTYDVDGKLLALARAGANQAINTITFSYVYSKIIESRPTLFELDGKILTLKNGNLETVVLNNYTEEHFYDNNPNAYGKIGYGMLGSINSNSGSDYPAINANNLVETKLFKFIDGVKSPYAFTKFIYEYDDDGFPISSVETGDFVEGGGRYERSYRYVYEK